MYCLLQVYPERPTDPERTLLPSMIDIPTDEIIEMLRKVPSTPQGVCPRTPPGRTPPASSSGLAPIIGDYDIGDYAPIIEVDDDSQPLTP